MSCFEFLWNKVRRYLRNDFRQECIPVGCVPSATVAVSGGGGCLLPVGGGGDSGKVVAGGCSGLPVLPFATIQYLTICPVEPHTLSF